MAIDTAILKSTAYFSVLNDKELDIVGQVFSEKTFQRGEIILWEGETSDTFFLVAAGAVKVFKTSAQGKEQILSIARPGDVLNDIPIFDGKANPVGAQALGPVILYGIKRDKFQLILRQSPGLTLNAIKVLAERTRHLFTLVEDLSFRHVMGRVVKILLTHAGDGVAPVQRLTQQEMAAMAGTAREVVARSLKALEEQGYIRLENHRIVISDKESLQKILTESI
ncbi:MAG: Crp/Fnr family transcriptional regulator [Dehalococcoidales bacterium]|nr:Crp/Fnr family transcriptional regulator [Dehalococcoidales bacterium]